MSVQEMVKSDANHPQRLPDIFEPAPTLASYNNGWSNITLEAYHLSPGETPEYCLNHYVVSLNMGQRLQVERVVEGKCHRANLFHGTVAICPIYSPHSFRWDNKLQTLSLNLKSELLNQHAIELLGIDCVELIPQLAFQDGLIYQIGLALQAELRSQGGSSHLYAETMANTLAVHLLRHYSNQGHRTVNCTGGLSQQGLRGIERVTEIHHTTVMHWIREAGHQLPDAPESEEIPEVTDLDELQTFVGKKHHKLWIWTAVNHKQAGILAWVIGDRSAETFKPLWLIVKCWHCFFYVTDGWKVYPMFIEDGDQIISKTYMTRVEGENTRLRHYLARLHRKTLCYSKSVEMLKCSLRLLLHYLRYRTVPLPA